MDIGTLKSCMGNLTKNVFFCGSDENDQNTSIFAKDEKTRKQLIGLLHQQKSNPEFRSIKIETTRSLKLKKTRSLEEIISRVPHQNIHLDPTATIGRASVLVSIAKESRQLLGSVLKGCYFNSEKRNLHFLINTNNLALDLTVVQKQLEPIIMHNTQHLSNPFYYSITISLLKPQGAVVAVDNASIVDESLKGMMKGFMKKLKWPLLVVSATSSLGMIGASAHTGMMSHSEKSCDGTLPAVSNVNGWVGGAAALLDNKRTTGVGGVVEAGIAAPLTHALGAQLHTYDGVAGSGTIVSVDGYVFWRDPAQALLGPHVSYAHSNNYTSTLYGLHGEGYLDSLTLVLEGGGANKSRRGAVGYGEALVHWYAMPDWRLYAGGITVGGDVTGAVGTEYQLGLNSLPGLGVFADAGVGSHDLSYGFLGLRYYFGDSCNPCKSLIRRQREDMVLPTLNPIDPLSFSHV